MTRGALVSRRRRVAHFRDLDQNFARRNSRHFTSQLAAPKEDQEYSLMIGGKTVSPSNSPLPYHLASMIPSRIAPRVFFNLPDTTSPRNHTLHILKRWHNRSSMQSIFRAATRRPV